MNAYYYIYTIFVYVWTRANSFHSPVHMKLFVCKNIQSVKNILSSHYHVCVTTWKKIALLFTLSFSKQSRREIDLFHEHSEFMTNSIKWIVSGLETNVLFFYSPPLLCSDDNDFVFLLITRKPCPSKNTLCHTCLMNYYLCWTIYSKIFYFDKESR